MIIMVSMDSIVHMHFYWHIISQFRYVRKEKRVYLSLQAKNSCQALNANEIIEFLGTSSLSEMDAK
jgi:hypothetical protein